MPHIISNINPIREILNNPDIINPTDYEFVPLSEETLLTGIMVVAIGLDDGNNSMEIEVFFIGDAPKASFLANEQAKILIGDIEFSCGAGDLVDGGAGLPLIGAINLGTAYEAQMDYANFIANKRIEINY